MAANKLLSGVVYLFEPKEVMFDELFKVQSYGLHRVAHLEFLLCCIIQFEFCLDIPRTVTLLLQELSADSILAVIAVLLVCRDRDLLKTMESLKAANRHSL